MKGFMLLAGAVVLWIVLNRWVLPWFGIHTCMSGGCTTECCPTWNHTDKDGLEQGNQK